MQFVLPRDDLLIIAHLYVVFKIRNIRWFDKILRLRGRYKPRLAQARWCEEHFFHGPITEYPGIIAFSATRWTFL